MCTCRRHAPPRHAYVCSAHVHLLAHVRSHVDVRTKVPSDHVTPLPYTLPRVTVLDPNVAYGAVRGLVPPPPVSCVSFLTPFPSHLLHSYQLPGSLEPLPGYFSPAFLFYVRLLIHRTAPSILAQRRKPLLRSLPSLGQVVPLSGQVVPFSRMAVGSLPSPVHGLSQYIHRVINPWLSRGADC